ncbi:DNA alkylation repair protein [Erythrobacter sp. SG61-1L]|uniref:DNA alkylation repair protein n=1 Tax=Erythrobacter sp. SG61-1L TaxID=1603897 RepID=UPI0006C908DA|nr:DNA alkylation repair protein [Erythrobacter sp. SG61-1L]KPL69369.1 DNA alkylation repair protein [Erythrobacter sp. SG61-1L]
MSATPLARSIRSALEGLADPARAPGMQAYMKSTMPYLGVSTPVRRRMCRDLFKGLEFASAAEWQAEVLAIWRGAEFREERYCAVELAGIRQARSFQRMDALAMYEELIVTGGWWDYVDWIASQHLFAILKTEPEPMKRAMLDWSVGEDMWKRRSAILCQLLAKQQTDLDLLYAAIAPSIGSKEFFLRKAIGWALRQYARTDPAEVARYVAAHEAELSPLSKREALKHIA